MMPPPRAPRAAVPKGQRPIVLEIHELIKIGQRISPVGRTPGYYLEQGKRAVQALTEVLNNR